jgi:hypothetical protein
MTSPQKQDEQQESDQLHRATRQQDASQEGDAPRLDQTAEAAALGDNLDESQPRLAGHQDAFRGSNAEPGNPLNTDQLEDALGAYRGSPSIRMPSEDPGRKRATRRATRLQKTSRSR